MSGDDLLQKLLEMSAEERKLPVVVEGENGWFYGASDVGITNEKDGKEDFAGQPCIAIRNNF